MAIHVSTARISDRVTGREKDMFASAEADASLSACVLEKTAAVLCGGAVETSASKSSMPMSLLRLAKEGLSSGCCSEALLMLMLVLL